jgi:hypothetical protein
LGSCVSCSPREIQNKESNPWLAVAKEALKPRAETIALQEQGFEREIFFVGPKACL